MTRHDNLRLMANVKFSSKIEEKVLEELRAYAEESHKNISDVLNEAVSEHLSRVRVRPAFRRALVSVLDRNEALLRKLAE